MNEIDHPIDRAIFNSAALCCAGGMQRFDSLCHLGHYLMQAANIPGDVVEFGCNEGKTAAFMAKLTTKRIWVYDSFRGIPRLADGEKVAEVFKEGLMAVDHPTCAITSTRPGNLPRRSAPSSLRTSCPKRYHHKSPSLTSTGISTIRSCKA